MRDGVSGSYRTYSIRGTAYATRFVADLPAAGTDAAGYDFGMPEGDGERMSGPRANISATGASYDASVLAICSTTWDSVVYEGTCATQQEIDDAIATVGAMNAEITADYAEAQDLCLQRWGQSPDCMLAQEEENLSAGAQSDEFSTDLADYPATESVASFSMMGELGGAPCGTADVGAASPSDQDFEAPRRGCVGEAIDATAKLVGWGFAYLRAYNALVHGASKIGVVAAVGSTLAGGFATGWAIGTWMACVA